MIRMIIDAFRWIGEAVYYSFYYSVRQKLYGWDDTEASQADSKTSEVFETSEV